MNGWLTSVIDYSIWLADMPRSVGSELLHRPVGPAYDLIERPQALPTIWTGLFHPKFARQGQSLFLWTYQPHPGARAATGTGALPALQSLEQFCGHHLHDAFEGWT